MANSNLSKWCVETLEKYGRKGIELEKKLRDGKLHKLMNLIDNHNMILTDEKEQIQEAMPEEISEQVLDIGI